jgi:hypothetical protein
MNDQNDSINRALYVLRYFPGVAVLAYAYLYLLGYLYLFFYFSRWGLNVHEIGFSIVDYATVALYPCSILLIFAIGFFLIGFRLRNRPLLKPSKREQKKIYILINRSIGYFTPILWTAFAIYEVIKHKSIWSWTAMLFFVPLMTYGLGILAATYRIKKKSIYFNWACVISLFVIIALLFFAGVTGNLDARADRKYSFNMVSELGSLTEVTILSQAPIGGMEVFQVVPNRYEGLSLLTFKGDIYYFVPFVGGQAFKLHFGSLNQRADELMKEITDNLEEVKKKQGQSNNEQIAELLKQIEKKQDNVKKGNLSIEAKRALLNEIDNDVRSATEQLRKSDTLSKETRHILDLAREKLKDVEKVRDEIKNYFSAFSLTSRSCYAIRSSEIVTLIYLHKNEPSEPAAESKKDNQKKS